MDCGFLCGQSLSDVIRKHISCKSITMIWDELINFGQRQQCMHVSMRFIKLLQPEVIFFNLAMFVVSSVCFTHCALLRSTPKKFF